jgi:ketosteroid isomerase-like protein
MLKKFFLPCLAAAIVLPLPLNVNAAITQLPTLSPLRLASTDKALSSEDINDIKKQVDSLINAQNTGDVKKALSYYSKKYQGRNSKGEVVTNYNTLSSLASSKYSSIFKAHDETLGTKREYGEVKISGLDNKRASAQFSYKINHTKLPPNTSTEKNHQNTMFLTFEKISNKWLIVASKSTISTNSETIVNNEKKQPTTQVSKQDQEFFVVFFNRHLDALNRKNLNDYLATLDASSPQYKKSKEETVQLFKEYTLKFTAQSVKLVSRDKNEAVVEMVATVKKVSGGGFKDSKMKTTNFLKKSDGKWRIVDTSIDSVTELVAKK